MVKWTDKCHVLGSAFVIEATPMSDLNQQEIFLDFGLTNNLPQKR